MNCPALNVTDFERTITILWAVAQEIDEVETWLYQKTKLEGLILLYTTGDVVDDLMLLVGIAEFFLLQLECDMGENSQELCLENLLYSEVLHSMGMIKSHQALLETIVPSGESRRLLDDLSHDYAEMKSKFASCYFGAIPPDADEIGVDEKTRLLCNRLVRSRDALGRCEIK